MKISEVIEIKTFQGIDTYKTDDGQSWSDTAGRHAIGDMVSIEAYLMGTVRVVNLTKQRDEALAARNGVSK